MRGDLRPPTIASTLIDTPSSGNHAAASYASALPARILVVDDDEQVRTFVADALQAMGYSVTESADPAAAMQLFAAQHFDLLLADFAMPGMNGAELARAAQEQQPGLPVLIVSGYAESAGRARQRATSA
jgi:CheY-like chemotaxis protein